MANIPPPPAGFTIVPQGASNIPPPPAGFTLNQPPQQIDQPLSVGGLLSAGGSGVAQGAMDLVGLPGTIADYVNNKLSDALGWEHLPAQVLSGHNIRETASEATGGATEYKPQNKAEKYVQTAGSFVPGAVALGGSGSVLENVGRYAVIPGVASEAAGQATEGTQLEPYARLAAAILSPVAVEAGVRGVNAAADAATSLSPKAAAAKNLAEALSAAGSSPADVTSAMAANPRLTAMDVNPNMQQMGQNLVTQGGAPRATLNDMVTTRAANAPDVVEGIYDSAMGQVPNVKTYLDKLKATTQANAKTGFDNALKNAGPVDVSPVLAHIDNAAFPGVQQVVQNPAFLSPQQQALLRVKSMLANDSGQLTDANKLHSIQSGLRTEADALSSSANGSERLTGKALGDVRQKIIDQIDQSSNGQFRPAQQQYADDMDIQRAFDKGRTIFNGGGPSSDAALYNRPEYWQDWKAQASAPEISAAKVGIRVAADNALQGVRNAAAKGEAIPEVGFNRDRLEIMLGKPETDKLVKALQDEKNIAQTNAKLFAGSQTADRQAVSEYTKVTQPNNAHGIGGASLGAFLGHEVGGIPGMAAGAAMGGATRLVQAVMKSRDLARNSRMAEALSGNAQTFQNAVSAGPSGPLIAPTRLADPRVSAIAAALLAREADRRSLQPTR